jgi:Alpha/beta hydrolase domain
MEGLSRGRQMPFGRRLATRADAVRFVRRVRFRRMWRSRSRLVAMTTSVATALPTVGPGAAHAAPAAAGPVVEGPIGPHGLWGHPWNDQFFELGSIGYAEEEYFASGTAKTYTAAPSSADFKSRILVYRPTDARRFNGTTIVEWDNVTAQNAEEPMWTWLHPMVFRDGYAYVFVSAQAAAICCGPRSHKAWDRFDTAACRIRATTTPSTSTPRSYAPYATRRVSTRWAG